MAWLWVPILVVSCGKKSSTPQPSPPPPVSKTLDFIDLLPDGTTQVRCVEFGMMKGRLIAPDPFNITARVE